MYTCARFKWHVLLPACSVIKYFLFTQSRIQTDMPLKNHTVWILIRLLLNEQSDLDLHCLLSIATFRLLINCKIDKIKVTNKFNIDVTFASQDNAICLVICYCSLVASMLHTIWTQIRMHISEQSDLTVHTVRFHVKGSLVLQPSWWGRELVALLSLSSWWIVVVVRLFHAVPRVCLQFVIVVFPDHTHYFLML